MFENLRRHSPMRRRDRLVASRGDSGRSRQFVMNPELSAGSLCRQLDDEVVETNPTGAFPNPLPISCFWRCRMKISLYTLTLALLWSASAIAAPPAPAQAPTQAAKPPQAPTQKPVQAPTKTAQAVSGYRTYSHQPGTTTTYSRRSSRENNFFSGFYSAGWKVNGDFWAR